MNDWQEFLARITVGRVFENKETVKTAIVNNGFIRTFGIVDEDGNVDIERLASDMKREIQRKEKLTVSIPLFGTITFHPEDVDSLYNMIMEGTENESY